MALKGEEDDVKLFADQISVAGIGPSDVESVEVDVSDPHKDPQFEEYQRIGRMFEEHEKKLAEMRKQHKEALKNLDQAWKKELSENKSETEDEATLRNMRHQQHLAEVEAHSAEELYTFENDHLVQMEAAWKKIDPNYVPDENPKGNDLIKESVAQSV